MTSRDSVISDYMGFMPHVELMKKHKLKPHELDVFVMESGYAKERAQGIVDNLEDLDDTLPSIVRESIWQLQVLKFLASKFSSGKAEDLIKLKTISNSAIKAKLEDYSTWGEIQVTNGLEVTVISNEHKIDVEWVIAMGATSLETLVVMSKGLRDTVTLKDHIQEVPTYKDWDAHSARCKAMGLPDAPAKYTEAEGKHMEKRMKQFEEIDND